MRLRPQTLEYYVALARPILIEVAQGKRGDRATRTICYSDLMSEMGGPGLEHMSDVLEEVSDREYPQSDTILSAMVVAKVSSRSRDKWRPSKGWWELRVLPLVLRNAPTVEKLTFWRNEHDKACTYWQNNGP